MSDLSNVAAPPRSVSSNKLRFYGSWIATAIALLALPYIFSSGGSLTTFSLIGISIIFSLSYNILLGQTGMLSFGHAVYYGLGGFLAIHGMNLIAGIETPGTAAAGAFDWRNSRLVLCRYSRMGSNPSQRHGVRNDFAWRRRTSRLLLAHPA